MRRMVLGFVVGVVGAATLPAVAQADDELCVPSPCGPGTGYSTLTDALSAATATATPTTIRLGAGPFNAGSSNPFFGNDGGNGTNTLTIIGAGKGSTVISRPTGDTVLQLQSVPNSGTFTLRDLSIVSASNANLVNAFGPLVLDNVEVRATGSGNGAAVVSDDNLTVTRSEFTGTSNSAFVCASDTAQQATITESVFTNCGTGFFSIIGNSLTVSRSRFVGGGVDSTYAVRYASAGNLRFYDNLVARAAGASGLQAQPPANQNASVVLKSNTFAGSGTGNRGIDLSNAASGSSVTGSFVYNAVTGFQFSVLSPLTVNSDYNYFDFGTASSNFEDLATDIDDVPAVPGFVNAAAGNYQLAPGSILIDKGTAATDGTEPTVDLAGNPRVVGGLRDVGAFEVQPPVVNPAAPGGGSTLGPAISSIKAGKAKRKKKAKVTYTLSAPANVTFTATSKKKGKKKPKTTKLGSQAAKAGANAFSFKVKLKAGKYTLTATPAGGSAKTASLTVKK